jgi:hypothetical protein
MPAPGRANVLPSRTARQLRERLSQRAVSLVSVPWMASPAASSAEPEPIMDTANFSPEVAENAQAAFERVCKTLGIGAPDHYVTVIVAAKITHFANAGVHDADELSRAVLKDFKLLE